MARKNTTDSVQFGSAGGDFQYSQHQGADGIHYAKFIGYLDGETSLKIYETIQDAYHRAGSKLVYVADVNELADVAPIARINLIEHLLSKDTPLRLLAAFGGSFYIRQLLHLFAKICTFVPIRVFETKDEAGSWVARELQNGGGFKTQNIR